MDDDLLSVEETAGLLGYSVATVRRKCASGELKAEKVGRQWVIDRHALPAPRQRRSTGVGPVSFDLDRSLEHLRKRDLTPAELWVPDVLMYRDLLIDEAALKEEAARRIENVGPFDALMEIPVPKNALFIRAATAPTLVDRLVYHACILAMADAIEDRRLDAVLSARLSANPHYLLENGRDAFLTWKSDCKAAVEGGSVWMVKTDIVGYFDNIPHKLLFADLDALGVETQAVRVTKRLLAEWSHQTSVGIPQGPDASRLIGNHYLNVVDRAMTSDGWVYLRYMDDIAIFGETRHQVQAGIRRLQAELRRRGLSIATKKTELLHGTEALESFDESALDDAQYEFVAKTSSARSQLKKIFRESIKREGNVVVRWARFALYRLRALRDGDVLRTVLDRMEDLAPVATIVAAYLLPWLDRTSVERRLGSFFNDPDRNTSPYLATWLLAAALEKHSPMPETWLNYAREVAKDGNRPPYLRAVAANVMALGRRPGDLDWLERELRSEWHPMLLRGYTTALARGGGLHAGISKALVARRPELEVTVEYLRGRANLPSLVYSDQYVAL